MRYDVRLWGDPVLKRVAEPVLNIDDALVDVCNSMLDTMYEVPGIGLAAPQVGISKRFFVFDMTGGEDPGVIINPVIAESSGEWVYEEGCLSVPGLSWEIIRPREIFIRGYDLDGKEMSLEVDDLAARLFQHELDHLDGTLLLDYLDDDQVKDAKRILRERAMLAPQEPSSGLQLP